MVGRSSRGPQSAPARSDAIRFRLFWRSSCSAGPGACVHRNTTANDGKYCYNALGGRRPLARTCRRKGQELHEVVSRPAPTKHKQAPTHTHTGKHTNTHTQTQKRRLAAGLARGGASYGRKMSRDAGNQSPARQNPEERPGRKSPTRDPLICLLTWRPLARLGMDGDWEERKGRGRGGGGGGQGETQRQRNNGSAACRACTMLMDPLLGTGRGEGDARGIIQFIDCSSPGIRVRTRFLSTLHEISFGSPWSRKPSPRL